MITFPTSIEAAGAAQGRLRAGGTDEQELRHRGIVSGAIVDLRDVGGLDAIESTEDGGLRIGALVTLRALAADERLRAGYPGLAAAAGGLATPQIRARASVAGSLLQEVRCWYFRHRDFDCQKKGGAVCYARGGDHALHSAIDLGPCIAPHPSTMACALWAFDAQIEVDGALRDVPALLGPGTDPRRTHALEPGQVLTAVVLPPPVAGERSAYFRAIHRARAEWPLVEVTARVGLAEDGTIGALVLSAGGVANRPIRFDDAARALVGLEPDDPKVDTVLAALGKPAENLPGTAYKARLIPTTLRETLDRALASAPVEVP
jgi:xanthine dehydrogenase YagS FAD-binding subunit